MIKEIKQYPSAQILIIANAITLVYLLLNKAEVSTAILLFWLETAIIGLMTVIKIIIVAITQETKNKENNKLVYYLLPNLFNISFLILHLTGFMIGHLIVIITLFGKSIFNTNPIQVKEILTFILKYIPIIVILLLSHSFSLIQNFINKQEYKKAKIEKLLFMPYARVTLLHFSLIAFAFIIIAFQKNSNYLIIVLTVIIKTMADLFSHISERKKFQ